MSEFNRFFNPEEDNISMINNPPDDLQTISEQPQNEQRQQDVDDDTSATQTASETSQAEAIIEDLDTVHTSREEPINIIPIAERPLNYYNNQVRLILVNHSAAKPIIERFFTNKKRIHAQLSRNNFENDFIKFLKKYIPPKIKHAIYFASNEMYEPLCEIIRRIFKNTSFDLVKCNGVLEDVNNKERQTQIIRNYHEGKTNHRGITEVETQIKRRYYWPSMRNHIQENINICETCQTSKYDRFLAKPKFMLTPTPTKPLQIIHMDVFQVSSQKFLTIVDTFSKYGQAYPIESSNARNTVNAMVTFITHHGIPHTIVCDNGPEFKNGVFQGFARTQNHNTLYNTRKPSI